jgi:hypothetical protein
MTITNTCARVGATAGVAMAEGATAGVAMAEGVASGVAMAVEGATDEPAGSVVGAEVVAGAAQAAIADATTHAMTRCDRVRSIE